MTYLKKLDENWEPFCFLFLSDKYFSGFNKIRLIMDLCFSSWLRWQPTIFYVEL